MSPAAFHFLRPAWLLALVPLVVLLVALARRRLGAGQWARVCDAALLPHLLGRRETRPRPWPLIAAGAGGLLAILALAGPTWSRLPQPLYRDTNALVVVLDLSHEMDAPDLAPSRLTRARFKIADVLNARKADVNALLVYAGDAFTVTPLSTDVATIESQLGALGTDLMPVAGQRADLALAKAGDLLAQGGFDRGNVLLVTDRVDLHRTRPVAARLLGDGYRVSVLGVGTTQGAPIPTRSGGFYKDAHGAILVPRLDPASLAALARAGGGIYQTMRPDGADVDRLLAAFASIPTARSTRGTRFEADVWNDRGPWLLLLLLPLAALAFRRGLLVVLLALSLPWPRPAAAFDWTSLWQRPDQRAASALAHGDAKRAARLFRDPKWRGVADYRAGNYRAALASLAHDDSARGWYDRGNALARLGKYRQAIAAYDKSLAVDPHQADARFNRDLVRKQLKRRQSKSSGGKSKAGKQGARHETRSAKSGSGSAGHRPAGSKPGGAHSASSRPAGKPGTAGNAGGSHSRAGPQQARTAQPKPAGERKHRGATASAGTGPRHRRAPAPAGGNALASNGARALDRQLLRRIPDDPGGLLRRKFMYEYRHQHRLSL